MIARNLAILLLVLIGGVLVSNGLSYYTVPRPLSLGVMVWILAVVYGWVTR